MDDFRPQSAPGMRIAPTPPNHTPRPATAIGMGSMRSYRSSRPASSMSVHSSRARPRSAIGHMGSQPLVASQYILNYIMIFCSSCAIIQYFQYALLSV